MTLNENHFPLHKYISLSLYLSCWKEPITMNAAINNYIMRLVTVS